MQAPPFVPRLYKRYGFEEVGEYAIELGDYGIFPKEKRTISGEFAWKFMILRETGGSTFKEPHIAPKADKGKSKEQ